MDAGNIRRIQGTSNRIFAGNMHGSFMGLILD